MKESNSNPDGSFTQMPNELLEKLYSSKLNWTELSICLFIIRKTIWWNKEDDSISLTQFAKSINTAKSVIIRGILSLVSKNILIQTLKWNISWKVSRYKINKNISEWISLVTKLGLVTKSGLDTKMQQPSHQIDTSPDFNNNSIISHYEAINEENQKNLPSPQIRTYKINNKYNIQNKEEFLKKDKYSIESFIKVIDNFNSLTWKNIKLSIQHQNAIEKAFNNWYSIEDIDLAFINRSKDNWWKAQWMDKDFISLFREKTKNWDPIDWIARFKDSSDTSSQWLDSNSNNQTNENYQISNNNDNNNNNNEITWDPDNINFLFSEYNKLWTTKFNTKYWPEALLKLLEEWLLTNDQW